MAFVPPTPPTPPVPMGSLRPQYNPLHARELMDYLRSKNVTPETMSVVLSEHFFDDFLSQKSEAEQADAEIAIAQLVASVRRQQG